MEQTNWNRYFAYLKFLRWYRFYQYLFLFIFFALTFYYFLNKEIQYVRNEWTIFDTKLFTSSVILEPEKYYYFNWDISSYGLVYVEIDDERFYFNRNNKFNNFFTSTRKPVDIGVHIFQREFNPFSDMFSIKEVNVKEVTSYNKSMYMTIDTLKYYLNDRIANRKSK